MNRSSNRFTPKLESLDERINLSASPLPVLMVLADQQDFYYKEHAEVSSPTGGANFQFGDGSVRFVKDTIDLKPTDPQAAGIAFVGGWGSSMYQYAYDTPTSQSGGILVGLGDGSVRGVQPAAAADASDYSAIVFVGGWGSSM